MRARVASAPAGILLRSSGADATRAGGPRRQRRRRNPIASPLSLTTHNSYTQRTHPATLIHHVNYNITNTQTSTTSPTHKQLQHPTATSNSKQTNYNKLHGSIKYNWITFRVDDSGRAVVPDRVGGKGATYADFVAALPPGECRYGGERPPSRVFCLLLSRGRRRRCCRSPQPRRSNASKPAPLNNANCRRQTNARNATSSRPRQTPTS